MAHEAYETFDQVKTRLDEIVDAVGSEDLPLDDALALYEEAVGLGLRASELLEEDIEEHDAEDELGDETATGDDANEAPASDGAAGASADAPAASPTTA